MNLTLTNGTQITLTQAAYIEGTSTNVFYTALAQDKDGEFYRVIWDILDMPNFENLQDETQACDWQNPRSINLA